MFLYLKQYQVSIIYKQRLAHLFFHTFSCNTTMTDPRSDIIRMELFYDRTVRLLSEKETTLIPILAVL